MNNEILWTNNVLPSIPDFNIEPPGNNLVLDGIPTACVVGITEKIVPTQNSSDNSCAECIDLSSKVDFY